MGKLTTPQLRLLRHLDGGDMWLLPRSFHRPMAKLISLGLATHQNGEWQVTPAGRLALATESPTHDQS